MKPRNTALAVSILCCAGLVLAAVGQKGGFAAASSAARPGQGKQEADGGNLILRRIAWFHKQRAYPLQHIPAFARERAWHAFRQMQLRQAQLRAERAGAAMSGAVADPATPWITIGPQPTNSVSYQPFVSGRVTAIAVDPQDSSGQTVFLTGAQGGLWVTTDGGAQWVPAADQTQLPSLAASSVALDATTHPPIVYVGTGEENFSFDSYYGAGVLKCQSSGSLTAYVCTPDQTLGSFHSPSSANNQTASPLDARAGGPFVGGLAIDPQNSQVLLAAVQGFQSSLPSGVWCSSDAGVTWHHIIPSLIGVVATGVAFDADGSAYAALGSLDGNAAEQAATGNPAYSTINGIYKAAPEATACGFSFNQLTLPVPDSSMGRIALAVGPSASGQTHGEVFAAIATASDRSDQLLGVFKSVDGGNTWIQPSSQGLVSNSGGFCNDQCFYDLTIAIDPQNPNVVFAGGKALGSSSGATLVESTDGGVTWGDVSNNASSGSGIHVDLHAIAFKSDGSTIYTGTDGGVWSAANPASPPLSWNNLNGTLALTQFYPGMSLDPSGWQFLSLGGTQDNGTQIYSGAAAWNDTNTCGDGGGTAIDFQTPSTVYVACEYVQGEFLNIYKSLFSGNSGFFRAVNGILPTDPGNFIPPFAIDPINTENLYWGTNHVWQTQDGANTWRAISPDVTGATSPEFSAKCGVSVDCVLTSIAVAPTNPSEIVTGSSIGHVSISVNGGETWTDVTGISELPPRAITHVAADPHNSNVLYATFSGFSCPANVNCSSLGFNSGDSFGHVFQGALTITNTGTPPTPTPSVTWTDLSTGLACTPPAANLPNIPVNDLVIDPDPRFAGIVYAATDVGALEGNVQPTGTCWQPLGAGLPNVAVLSLELDAASRTLVAGTHGRSAWALQLGGLPAFSLGELAPTTANAGGSAFTLNLTGTGFTPSSTANWTPASGATTSLAQSAASASCGPPTCIAVGVPANLIAASGIAHVNVADPAQPNPTNQLTFTVVSQAPTIANISPTTGTAPLSSTGALATTGLAITGTNFAANTTVSLAQLNLLPANCASTTFNSATSLTTLLSAGCFQQGGTFFVIANNPAPGGGSSNQTLSATDPGSCQGSSNPGCLLTIAGAAPSNDVFTGATSITTNTYTNTEDTSGAAAGSGPSLMSLNCGHSTSLGSLSPPPASNGDAKAVWFSFAPTQNLTAEVDTIGSNYNTILSAWTGSSVSSLTNVGCNDDIVPGFEKVSQIANLALTANTTYYFMVSAYGIPTSSSATVADGGKLVFNLNAQTPSSSSVAFTATETTPSPNSIVAGSSASFTITFTPQPASPSGAITLDPCTSSPPASTITCSYSPSATVQLGSSGTATADVTIHTVARSFVPPRGGPFRSPPLPWVAGWLAAMLALGFAALRRPVTRRPATALALAVFVAGLLLSQGGCGGKSTSSTAAGTQAGTYTITVPSSPAAANGSITASVTVR